MAATLGVWLAGAGQAVALAAQPGAGAGAGQAAAVAVVVQPTVSAGLALSAGPSVAAVSRLAVGVPPMPTHVALRVLKHVILAGGGGYVRVRITWREPAGAASRFKVIGVVRCVNDTARTNGKPCVVGGMFIRAADLRVLGSYSGTTRSATLTIRLHGEVDFGTLWGNSSYFALLLGAYNARGESFLAIVKSATVCHDCTF